MLQASTKILQLLPRKENAIQCGIGPIQCGRGYGARKLCLCNDLCSLLYKWPLWYAVRMVCELIHTCRHSRHCWSTQSVVMPTGCSCFLCYVLRHWMFILILSWFPWVLSCHPLPVTMETVLPLPPIGPVHLVQQDCKNGGFLLHHYSPHPCLPGKSAKSLGEVKL